MDISIDFDVECSVCGGSLRAEQMNGGLIDVEPCEACLDESYNEGKKEGEESHK